ncbi:MAG: hypothetical protein V3W41_06160 [Planctomycetota bacterium]
MSPHTRRSILPLALFGLALGGGIWIWLITENGKGEDVSGILSQAHESLGDSVYELRLDLEATESLLTNSLRSAAAKVMPRQELIVGSGGCFHYQFAMDGLLGERPHSFHLGCTGDETWSFFSGEDAVHHHDSLDSQMTTDPLSPLALRALKRALSAWTETRAALSDGGGALPARLELVDKVRRAPGSKEMYWRFETKRSRGGERLRLWVSQARRIERIDYGALSFQVIARKDLKTEDFRIARWVPTTALRAQKR